MSSRQHLNADPLSWLLEPGEPGVRYLALRDLAGGSAAEVRRARLAAHKRGPIGVILSHMQPEGYWSKPGSGYNPKYRSTVWSLIALAQLGASVHEDKRIARACTYILDHSLSADGQFTSLTSGDSAGTIDCLQGNLCWAVSELGCEDPRLDMAFKWMGRTVTGEGLSPWPDLTYKTGPGFACGVNAGKPCAWGGVKVLLALAAIPEARRTAPIKRALHRAVDFFLAVDPASADYPTRKGDKPSRNWWKFGFPVFYVTDLIQLTEALVALGFGHDARLRSALDLIRGKQDRQGRWAFEFDYLNGKMWLDFGRRGQPNKWVTLRALRVLKAAAL